MFIDTVESKAKQWKFLAAFSSIHKLNRSATCVLCGICWSSICLRFQKTKFHIEVSWLTPADVTLLYVLKHAYRITFDKKRQALRWVTRPIIKTAIDKSMRYKRTHSSHLPISWQDVCYQSAYLRLCAQLHNWFIISIPISVVKLRSNYLDNKFSLETDFRETFTCTPWLTTNPTEMSSTPTAWAVIRINDSEVLIFLVR